MPVNPLDYEQPRPQGFAIPPDWRRRLYAAMLAGAIVFFLTLDATRREHDGAYVRNSGGAIASMDTTQIKVELDKFVARNAAPPVNLAELQTPQSPFRLIDPWGHPYALVNNAGKLSVISYGRDGAPGGVGFDADITSDQNWDDQPLPMSQFLQVARLTPILTICGGAALVTAAATFGVGRRGDANERRVRSLITSALITGILAVIVGAMITGLHVPSGH